MEGWGQGQAERVERFTSGSMEERREGIELGGEDEEGEEETKLTEERERRERPFQKEKYGRLYTPTFI